MALTFGQLPDEVMFNAFEGAAFTVRAHRFLNEAVNEIARRFGLSKGIVSVLAGALGGVVSCDYACALLKR